MKQTLTLRERMDLADEVLDIMGKDCRIFPPPVSIDQVEIYDQRKPEVSSGVYYSVNNPLTYDSLKFADIRCPAPLMRKD